MITQPSLLICGITDNALEMLMVLVLFRGLLGAPIEFPQLGPRRIPYLCNSLLKDATHRLDGALKPLTHRLGDVRFGLTHP